MPERYRVANGGMVHFVTITVTHWICVFCRQDYFQVLVDSFNYCIEYKGLLVYGFVSMPNHCHSICSQSDGRLSELLRDLKRHTSTAIAEKLREDGRDLWLRAFRNAAAGSGAKAEVWMPGFHPEEIHSRPFFDQKLKYLNENPVRAGYVEDPAVWKYSSAGSYYAEKPSVIPITPVDP